VEHRCKDGRLIWGEMLSKPDRNAQGEIIGYHGITREITLDVLIQGTDTDPWGNMRAGLEVIGKLNRKDFDMKFNQALGSGNLLVGDKVGVSLDISAVLQAS